MEAKERRIKAKKNLKIKRNNLDYSSLAKTF
jgi:hypothetical protein